MNLAFSTIFPANTHPVLADKPTLFVPKILKGIERQYPGDDNLCFHLQDYVMLQRKLHKDYKLDVSEPKLHTIRADSKDRWKPGNLIHFYIYSRTKNQLRFAPILKCTSTQSIDIIWTDPCGLKLPEPRVFIDGKWMCGVGLEHLAQNDGFNSLDEFFAYFNTTFKGKIIHWTDIKY